MATEMTNIDGNIAISVAIGTAIAVSWFVAPLIWGALKSLRSKLLLPNSATKMRIRSLYDGGEGKFIVEMRRFGTWWAISVSDDMKKAQRTLNAYVSNGTVVFEYNPNAPRLKSGTDEGMHGEPFWHSELVSGRDAKG